MADNPGMKNKRITIRFTPEEFRVIRQYVKDNTGSTSEFVRYCVNTQMAQAGDPEGMELLAKMISKGIRQTVENRVQAELKKRG